MSATQSRTVVSNSIYLYARSKFLKNLKRNWKNCQCLAISNFGQHRSFSSNKSPPLDSESAVAVQKHESESLAVTTQSPPSPDILPVTHRATTTQQFLRIFSDKDIREVDQETRAKIHKVSSDLAAAQSSSLINPRNIWRRKEILIMEEEEYADTYVLKPRPPLLDRVAGGESFFLRKEGPEIRNHTDNLAFIQADIDLRPRNVKRVLNKWSFDGDVIEQQYNPKRNKILGNELAAAHFIVARKGKVKFLGQKDWVTEYRKDAKPGVEEEDLPLIKMELCTLPTQFDPKYRVEAIDASKVQLHYEGLANFENLQYLKAISLRESPHIDDWCVEKIARIFSETLEYIDLSGCRRVSDRGIGVLHRCRNLKYIRVEDMAHLDNLEIVCAMLEDLNPNLEIVGVDYQDKMNQIKLENEKLERIALYEKDVKQLEPLDLLTEKQKLLALEAPKNSDDDGKVAININDASKTVV